MRFGILAKASSASISSKTIRDQLRTKRQRRADLIAARQSLARDELRGDLSAAAKRTDLDGQISVLHRDIQTLSDALPTVLDDERVARRHERERLVAELQQVLVERERARDALRSQLTDALLPTIDEMNALRLLSRECLELQHLLAGHTGVPFTAVDALAVLRSAVRDRYDEFERRWMRTKPDGRPDFTGMPWKTVADSLDRLSAQEQNESSL